MTDLATSPLGHATTYADAYDPALLFAVDRAPLRAELGLGASLPFRGVDTWTAYELSWLDARGKPQVAIATLAVPAASPCIVESKSVKLYLTAFNLTRFGSSDAVTAAIARDLTRATGAAVDVTLAAPDAFAALPRSELDGESLDALPIAGDAFLPVDTRNPQALAEALRRVAIREGLRQELADLGRARLAVFSLELEAGRLAHFLEAAARRLTP